LLFTNLKVLLSRAWQTLAHLDSRLTKSAAGGAAVSIFTGLLIGAFSGCFSEDKDGPRPPEPASRAQYAVFAASFACLEDKHIALEERITARMPQMRPTGWTDSERVQAIVAMADYGRSARHNANEMNTLLQGIRPPSQFATDHQELVDTAGLLSKLVDELDRSLPPDMNLAPQAILSEPALNDRILKLAQVANVTADTLRKREFTREFRAIYNCPTTTQLPRPTPTRIVPVVLPTLSAPPLPTVPLFFLTPLVPSTPTPSITPRTTFATPTPFSFVPRTPTPFSLFFTPTPGNPFGVR